MLFFRRHLLHRVGLNSCFIFRIILEKACFISYYRLQRNISGSQPHWFKISIESSGSSAADLSWTVLASMEQKTRCTSGFQPILCKQNWVKHLWCRLVLLLLSVLINYGTDKMNSILMHWCASAGVIFIIIIKNLAQMISSEALSASTFHKSSLVSHFCSGSTYI